MTDRELKNLTRRDLLQILLETEQENETLRRELKSLQDALKDREIRIEESGSLAEAVLRLNGVFEAAQAAADQYLDNIRLRNREQASIALRLKKENEAAREELKKTQEKCRQLEEETKRRCAEYVAKAKQTVEKTEKPPKQETTWRGKQKQ